MSLLKSRLRRLTLLFFAAFAGVAGFAGMSAAEAKTETAIFAGGCFWCVESDFDHVPGVLETLSGYTGGTLENPTYRDVTAGGSGHYEAVKITFDPAKTSYATLVDIFWRSVNPTDAGGQFCDRGASYATAIFATTDEQKTIAEMSKQDLDTSGKLEAAIVTPILPATEFYAAEDYHQDYYQKNPIRYNFYRTSCRRDASVEALWGDEAHRGITEH
ncbi:MAG: peptide-methionine (S)-S-oxide reductase [Sneathiella sp.]|nr:MAG: peptide-methionine (S)-S-oxide reductase [Sneathiella sp.]